VTPDTAGNERFGDVVIGEELVLGPHQLEIRHRRECRRGKR
jgi:hypothetical protein